MTKILDLLALATLLLATAIIVAVTLTGPLVTVTSNGSADGWLGFWGGVAGGVIGGLLTVAAAAIAWLSLKTQNDEARKQSAASAKIAMMHMPDDYIEEIRFLNVDVSNLCLKLSQAVDIFEANKNKDVRFNVHIDDIQAAQASVKTQMDLTAARFPDGYPTAATRTWLRDAVWTLNRDANLLVWHILHAAGAISDPRPTPGEVVSACKAIRVSIDAVEQCRSSHKLALESELKQVWRLIRELEARALS